MRKRSFYDSVYFDLLDAMRKNISPICLLTEKSERRYSRTLFYELYKQSFGLCMHHFLAVYSLYYNPTEEKSVLKQCQLYVPRQHL